MTLNLRQLIRDTARASTAADPAIVAKEVRDAIPDDLVGEALEQALYDVVYRVAARPGAPTSQVSPGAQSTPAGGSAIPSRKVAAIRDTWTRHLDDRVSVGRDAWKFVRDCTAEDCDYVAQARLDLAAANRAQADRWTARASLLRDHDAATIGDLPSAIARDLFTDGDNATVGAA